MAVPAIGASVGTPGEKNVLVCARTSPARQKAAKVPVMNFIVAQMYQQSIVTAQIQATTRSPTYPFIHVVQKSPIPYPSSLPQSTGHSMGLVQAMHDGDAKGPIVNVNTHGHVNRKQKSPHHNRDDPDDPIVPCRPLMHRTNPHSGDPPHSAIWSARRASGQACISLTATFVQLKSSGAQ